MALTDATSDDFNRRSLETIRAVILDYDRGEVELEPVEPNTHKKDIYACPTGHAYTVTTVAKFLAWVKRDGKGGFRASHACQIAFELEAVEGHGANQQQYSLPPGKLYTCYRAVKRTLLQPSPAY
jgi:hypothetical protein